MAVDAFAKAQGLAEAAWKKHHKTNALVAELMVGETKCLLAKPQTFMNESGQAVQDLIAFYKLEPKDVIVAHDELDLPFGSLRIQVDASAGGHNGVASVIERLGSKSFVRLRIGVGGAQRGKIPAEKYVLLPFSFFEKLKLKGVIKHAVEALECLASSDAQACMNRFN